MTSEFGELEGVIIHTPGLEVEEMTPETAKRALYSDILNLSVAQDEYRQLKGVLSQVCKCFEVKDLLTEVLKKTEVKEKLLLEIGVRENASDIIQDLDQLEAKDLAQQLIQGVPIKRDNLTRHLSQERFSLLPLHNFLFTRDASIAYGNEIIIGKMANKVRDREALIMETIFNNHPTLSAKTINPQKSIDSQTINKISIEGGDILVANKEVLVIGTGARTSTQGIDFILESIKAKKLPRHHIIIQELPDMPNHHSPRHGFHLSW